MIRLTLGMLRHHRAGYLGTFLAASLAVALLSGAGLLLYSALTARPPANRFAATTLMISGSREVSVRTDIHKKDKVKTKTKTERLAGAGTLPGDLPERVGAVPGVAATIPDSAFPVVVTGPSGQPVRGARGAPVIGHGWASARLTPYTIRTGTAPAAGTVVLDADLARRAGVSVGDPVTVTSRTGVRTMPVAGIAAPPGRDALPAQAAIFFADEDARTVSGLTGPTAVGVIAAPGTDPVALAAAVRAAAGTAPVLTGAERVRADLPGALPDYLGPISIFGFVIGITAFAAVFVLTGTVALAVRQRSRELALLRTTGATPGQLRRLLGLESIAVAALAAVPGCPLGVLVAEVVAARFRALGAVPAQFAVDVNVLVPIGGALAGLVVTVLAARIAARRAVRIAPAAALVETATAGYTAAAVRVPVAVVAACGAVAVLGFVPLGGPLGMGMSFVSSALLLCAVAALGPVLVGPVVAVLSRAARLGGPAGRLAGLLARARVRPVAAVAVPLTLMFAINATMLLNSALLGRLTASEQAGRYHAATVDVSAAGGMPLETARRLAALPGVTAAAASLRTRVVVVDAGKPQDYAAEGLFTAGTGNALDLGIREGALGGPGTFAASRYLAGQQGWHVGTEVAIWLADGYRVGLRLTAVYERSRGFGDLVLPADLVAAHDPRGLVSVVALSGAADLAGRVRATAPALRVGPPAAFAAADGSDQQGAWELMVVISLGFTAIAVVNTFAMATAARRREYTDLRLAGATVRQVHRLATAEAAIAAAVGLVLGCVVTGIVVGVFSTAQDGVFRLIVDPVRYGGMLAGVAALGLLAGSVPIRFVLPRRALPVAAERA